MTYFSSVNKKISSFGRRIDGVLCGKLLNVRLLCGSLIIAGRASFLCVESLSDEESTLHELSGLRPHPFLRPMHSVVNGLFLKGVQAMGKKRIFISDVHMGCDLSSAPRKPYVWFKKNAHLLAKFLGEQLMDHDVSEVVILGDLFDEWIIPADYPPITSFKSICSNSTNEPVITGLRALAADGRLVYVPGNHDMATTADGIAETKSFLEETDNFPGIRFVCDGNVPLGTFQDGVLAAEHGNRYCLFNAPDTWTNPGVCFLSLGYFISRMVAYKVSTTGHDQDPRSIFFDLLKEFWKGRADFEEDLFQSIADNCGLRPESTIELDGIPGCGKSMTISDIGQQFSRLFSSWGHVPGAEFVRAPEAVTSELGDLYDAAASTYFRTGSPYKVVIFGHTHTPFMKNNYENAGYPDFVVNPDETPCLTIYANSGTWIDSPGYRGNYVETEEIDGNRLYVRVKEYPGKTVIEDYTGFIDLTR